MKNISVLRVSSVGFFVETQLYKQIADLEAGGFDVHIITSDNFVNLPKSIFNYKKIKISRNIDILNDLIAVFELYKYIKKYNIKIVHSTTPKAGLLVAISAFFARAPIRIHTFTGQVWVNKSFFKKYFLKMMDKFIISLNTDCMCDGFGQRDFLSTELNISSDKLVVLGSGSLAGVDLTRFNLHVESNSSEEYDFRGSNGIGINKKIITFVGRINKDKGIEDLLAAFKILSASRSDIHLLLVGPLEIDLNNIEDFQWLRSMNYVTFVGYSQNPEFYLKFSYCLVLPSYREGFGTVVLEAAALRIPAILSDIYGLRDVVRNFDTGLVFPVGNVLQLSESMKLLVSDPELHLKLSNNSFDFVVQQFSSDVVSSALINFYQNRCSKINFF